MTTPRISRRTGKPVRAYRRKANGKPAPPPPKHREPAVLPVEDPRRTEVVQLAQALFLTAIQATGSVVQGEDVRHLVRQARVMFDEVDHPTQPKLPTPERSARGGPESDAMADPLSLDPGPWS